MVTRTIGNDTYLLSYDVENRLKEVKRNGVVTATFGYDGDGKMVTATVGVTTTFYVGMCFEKVGTITRTYYYHVGKRVAMRENASLYWLLTDHLGSTSMVISARQAVTGELRYREASPKQSGGDKAYGEARYSWGITTTTKYHFTGQREESTIGLYLYNARWYDPTLGRFIQADTIVPQLGNPQSLNRYSYVLNNPLRYVDPSGHAYDSEVGSGWDEEILRLSLLQRAYDIVELYKDIWPFAGGREVLQHRDKIVSVEQERGLPPGLLGAVIWHEGSAMHKGLDEKVARTGVNTTIGLAEISVETAGWVEEQGLIPRSTSRDERVSRLLNKEQNIEYAGAYLQCLRQWVGERMPQATEKLKWEIAVVAYNVGEGGLEQSFAKYGWGGLGPRGRRYYSQVIPYIAKVRGWLYGDTEKAD